MDIFDVARAPGSLDIILSPKLRHIDGADEETKRFLEENGVGVSPFGVLPKSAPPRRSARVGRMT